MAEKTDKLLIQSGGITQEELKNAIVKASASKQSLIEYVLADERVSEEGLADSIAAYARFPRVNLPTTVIDPEAIKLMPQETARKHLCIPIRVEARQLIVAMANPTDYRALQDIEFHLGRSVKVFVSTRSEILDAIEKYYEPDNTLRSFTESIAEAKDFQISTDEGKDGEMDLSKSLSSAELPPVIKVVNLIIQDGILQRATDIHVEPTLNDLQVRIRVDGVLRPLMQLPKWLTHPICSRLKILSHLDIAERRIPQDGRLKVQLKGLSYDLRISTLPTLFGEKVVMRILATETSLPTIDSLNFDDADRRILLGALLQPQGLILVTGPTGSGKTTTLCACLAYRKTPELNIITVEDPVEYQIPGINQVQVNVKQGLSFATALRSILRQDPDVVLVGEMRDLETTEIAFHASMTGHLVLSTLHTNSAVASVTRLIDLGVDPVLISSALTLVVAQRLLRKLCGKCKEPYDPPAPLLEKLGASPDETIYYRAAGCPGCGNTGFDGRMAIIELLPVTKTIRNLINQKESEVEIRRVLQRHGMRFLSDRGMDKVREGVTDISELFRVLQLEDEESHLTSRCPNCRAVVEDRFTICPSCLFTLNLVCERCNEQLKADWKICPYCKAPVSSDGVRMESSIVLGAVDSGKKALELPPAAPTELTPVETFEASGGNDSDETEITAAVKTPRILIVDDDPSIRIIVQKAIEQLPFPVETELASDGIQALEKVEEYHPDLIMLDIMMPGMDGFSVCQKLRSQVSTAFIPIMMLTANATEEGRTRGFIVGTDDFVSKPFSVPELNARVTRLLRRTYGIS